MRDDWAECCFGDLLNYEQPTKYIVERTDYNDSYKTPVLTAGKSFIKGYTNETDGIFSNLPVIIFDDFTTASQFVNFEFKVKSSAMKILLPTSKHVNMRLMFYCMQVNRVRNDTHKRYWISVYAKKSFSFPPLPEQRAIVAKIEALFSDLDQGITDLKTAQAQLKIYRQAVLKKAFEGELTKEWREQQTNLPAAEELLAQIKEERQKHYDQQIEKWETAIQGWKSNGKEGKKPAKPRMLTEFSVANEIQAELPNLHVQGAWIPLGNVFIESPQNGLYKPVSDYGTGTDIIRIDNFYEGKLVKINDFKKVRLSSCEIDKYSLQNDQILINRVNSIEYLGKSGLVKNLNKPTVFESNIMRLCILNNKMLPSYLIHFLTSITGTKEIKRFAKHAVNQASINQTDVSLTPIPLCSLTEQHQIVREIETRLSVCDEVEETIFQSLKKAEALRQSILKKAFEGRLLSEAELAACRAVADWEPASALLARIQAEKEK